MPTKKLPIIKAIKKWLKTKGNTKIELAFRLGYKSSSTINNWINRGSVPEYMLQRVREIVG